MVDRRDQLQEILDETEKGWVAFRPARGDVAHQCVFQKPDELKQALAIIPRKWFDDGDGDRIRQVVRAALDNAVVQS